MSGLVEQGWEAMRVVVALAMVPRAGCRCGACSSARRELERELNRVLADERLSVECGLSLGIVLMAREAATMLLLGGGRVSAEVAHSQGCTCRPEEHEAAETLAAWCAASANRDEPGNRQLWASLHPLARSRLLHDLASDVVAKMRSGALPPHPPGPWPFKSTAQ